MKQNEIIENNFKVSSCFFEKYWSRNKDEKYWQQEWRKEYLFHYKSYKHQKDNKEIFE